MDAFEKFKIVVYLYVAAAGLLILTPLLYVAAEERRWLVWLLAAIYVAMVAGMAYLFWVA